MRGGPHKGQTPVLTAEVQQLRTALHVFRNSPGTLETEALRAFRHYPRSAKRESCDIEELRALVAALPESGQRRRLLVPNLASIFGHVGLIAFVLLCASHQVSRSGLIPVSIELVAKGGHQSRPLEERAGPKEKSRLDVSQANPHVPSTQPLPNDSESADQTKSFGSADQTERAPPDTFSASAPSQEAAETYLWNANSTSVQPGGSLIDFSEQDTQASPGLKIVRKTDWQDNPVEDETLTYSTPGNAVRLTTREVSSAGFAGTNFVRDLSPNNDEAASRPFGLTATELGGNAIAKSQRVDFTFVDAKDFGVTVFGYQNEVGTDFKPFGQAKNEFDTPGTTTMTAGSQLRVGAFGFGFSQSNVTSSADAVPSFSESRQESLATKQEASVTVDLPHLLPGTEGSSGLTSELLPTLWVSASDKSGPSSGPGAAATDTITASIGGNWKWKDAYASLGYWDYSSNNSGVANSSWNGHGFDAAFGAYHSSFGLNLAISYGQSEDAAQSWQSAEALYNGTVTVSYAPSKLPGVWVSASTGNYNYNGALSDLYAVRTNNTYSSLTAGLDFTNWFWGTEASESSVKLLYRYSDNLLADSTTGTTKGVDDLVAVMVQRKF